jgi:hypothetical protein
MLEGAIDCAPLASYTRFSGDEAALEIVSNDDGWRSVEGLRRAHLDLTPSAGWRHNLETVLAR